MRAEKKAIVEELRGRMEGADYVFLAKYVGLSVELIAQLRDRLGRDDNRFHVVKNSFLKRAADDCGMPALGQFADGPTALIAGSGDVAAAAKALKAFGVENKRNMILGGVVEGQALSAEDVLSLASIPARPVLLGTLVGTIAAPMTGLVGAMSQKARSLLNVLKAVEEKKTNGDR